MPYEFKGKKIKTNLEKVLDIITDKSHPAYTMSMTELLARIEDAQVNEMARILHRKGVFSDLELQIILSKDRFPPAVFEK